MSEPLICAECGAVYELTEGEREWFANRKDPKTGKPWQLPKRCRPCRDRRKTEAKAPPRIERPLEPRSYPVREPVRELPPEKRPDDNGHKKKEEVRIILATTDFTDLVQGREVVWQGVHIVLADIGFNVMRRAIDEAERVGRVKAS